MNVNLYNTMAYENKSNWTLGENKPNSNPIKPNLPKGKIDAKCVLTKDYENETAFRLEQNKPNSNPIKACPERSRMGQFPSRNVKNAQRAVRSVFTSLLSRDFP